MLKIKELREEREISVDKLAKAIGVNPRTIFRWEAGEAELTHGNLISVADYFGCTTDYLLGREDDVGNVSVINSNLSPKEEKLIVCYRSLTQDGKTAFLSMAENIAGMYRRAVGKIS